MVFDISGRVVNNAGVGLPNLQVAVYHRADPALPELRILTTRTSASGDFVFPYAGLLRSLDVQLLNPIPTAQLRVQIDDIVGRFLWSGTPSLLTSLNPLPSGWNLGTITLQHLDVYGWIVTNLTGAYTMLAQNSRAVVKIDAIDAWSALETDIRAAAAEIHLQMFYLDVNRLFIRFTPDPPPIGTGSPTSGVRLEEVLVSRSRASPSLRIKLLIRDATLLTLIRIPYPTVTADPVESYFTSARPHSIEVRRYPTEVVLPMHAKTVVVDTKAHIIGSPFIQEYFDGQTHTIDDPRRGPLPLVGPGGYGASSPNPIRVPIHDVGVVLEGPAVEFIKHMFFLHWDRVGTTPGTSTVTSGPPASPNAAVQIVRTLPASTFPGLPTGETTILEAYLRAFAEAARAVSFSHPYVYLENQYFTEPKIADAIRLSLAANPNLQVIMLINAKVDIPLYGVLNPSDYVDSRWLDFRLYQGWQARLIEDLRRGLRRDSSQNRLGIFTIWTHDTTATPTCLIRNYVHSKVGIVNDQWATIGSANLDGVSLFQGQHIIPPLSIHKRATEVNAVIYNGVDGMPPSSVPGELRRQLWAEHLGYSSPTDPALMTAPAEGWLRLWSDRAAAKLSGLMATPPTGHASRILEWRNEPVMSDHLRALGVNPSLFNVVNDAPSFDFSTSNWIRRGCHP